MFLYPSHPVIMSDNMSKNVTTVIFFVINRHTPRFLRFLNNLFYISGLVLPLNFPAAER